MGKEGGERQGRGVRERERREGERGREREEELDTNGKQSSSLCVGTAASCRISWKVGGH